jgi:hypothetical protein
VRIDFKWEEKQSGSKGRGFWETVEKALEVSPILYGQWGYGDADTGGGVWLIDVPYRKD